MWAVAPVSVFQSVLRDGVKVEGKILALLANSIVDGEGMYPGVVLA